MKKIISTDSNGRTTVKTINELPSKTQQNFAASTNINNIMARYNNDMRLIPEPFRGVYGEFKDAPSFFEAQNTISQAKEAFLKLPSALRKRFDNEPGQLLAFLDDPNNLDEAIALGLCNPKPEPVVSQPLNDDDSNDNNQAKKHKVSKSVAAKPDPSES